MTDLFMTDERQMLANSVRRFVERGYEAVQRDASIAHPHGCVPETWRNFGEFGWLALPVPQDDGGMGGGVADVCVLTEELGRGAVNEPFIACAVLASTLLAEMAPDDVRSAWFPDLMEGHRRLSLAYETGLKASASDGGFLLRGETSVLPGGAGVDAYLLVAQVSTQASAGLFLMDANATGLTNEPCALYDGQRATRLRLNDVSVASALWLGPQEQLQRAVQKALDQATLAHCAETVGTMQRAYEITLDYLKTRKQFGHTIASNQVVQHRLVDLLIEIEEARALTRAAAVAIDDGASAPMTGARYTAAAKACVAHTARHVWKEAVQLHGAIGMTQEYEVGQFVKRLAAATTLYGSEEAHLERLATLSLDVTPSQL